MGDQWAELDHIGGDQLGIPRGRRSWCRPGPAPPPRTSRHRRCLATEPVQFSSDPRDLVGAGEAERDEEPVVRVGLPAGPGSDLLFRQLAAAWQTIGVRAIKVGMGQGAELELRDRLARYGAPRWYLNQFNCAIDVGLCSEETDALVRQSLTQRDPVAKQALLVEAHAELMEAEVFIPLGMPVRWSLVRGAVNGYQANPWGLHPLFPLSQPTT